VHALVQQLETGGPRASELSPVEIAVRAIRSLNASPLPAGSNVTIVVDHGWLRQLVLDDGAAEGRMKDEG